VKMTINKQLRSRERPPFLFAFIWLFYLAFPIATLWRQPPLEMALDFGLVAGFALCYIVSFRFRRARLLFILAQLSIIALFCFRYDSGFLYMAFYPSPVIGTLPSFRKMTLALGAMLLLFVSAALYYGLFSNGDQLLQMLPAMLVMLAMPFAIRISLRSKELRNKLTLANEEISRLSRVEERQRISRDLHDTLGHTLSLITLKSELTERFIAGGHSERAIKEVQDIQTTSRAALQQVRELVSGMNAVTIREEVDQAKKILSAAGILLETEGDMNAPISSPVIDNIVGLCLREAVTNVVKHSKAKKCTIKRVDESDRLCVSVTDNGSGGMQLASPGTTSIGGNGLVGIRERLKLVEGILYCESEERVGTTLTFIVPRVAKSIVSSGGRAGS